MKTKSTMLAAAAAAVLVAGLSQSAQANLSGTASVSNGANSIAINSSATLQTTGAFTGEYLYSYSFNDALAGGFASFSVYFNTANASPITFGPSTGPDPVTLTQKTATDLIWSFDVAPKGGAEQVEFYSFTPPSLGDTSAQDGGTWGGTAPGNTAFGVVVPFVPDGGSTIGLMGGALLGLQALRRKLVR